MLFKNAGIAFVAMAFALAGFQNCVRSQANSSASGGGNGENYDGKVYNFTNPGQTCADGTNIVAQITFAHSVFTLMRDNCANLAVPKILEQSEVNLSADGLNLSTLGRLFAYVENIVQPSPTPYSNSQFHFSAPVSVGVTGNAVQFADLNGDGKADLIQVEPDGTVSAQMNQGNLVFAAPQTIGQTGNQVMFADLNGDGKAELIQVEPDGTVIAQNNQGGLSFALPQTIGQTGNQVMFANLNKDDLADLIQVEPSGTLLAQFNLGALNFKDPQTFGQTGNRVMFADINGDGLADLIQIEPDGTVFVQFNQGGLGLGAPQIFAKTGNQVMFADVNGDGLYDLIQVNSATGEILVQLNLGP